MKKSRTFRKSFVAAIAALCLAAPLAVMPVQVETSYADETETATTTYKAYQIFSGTYSINTDNSASLGDIQWGSDIDTSKEADLLNEISQMGGFSGVKSAKDVSEKLGNGNAEAFAKVIEKYIKSENAGTVLNTSNNSYTASGVANGYYLVRTETVGVGDAKTRFILQVVDHTISVTPKKSAPTVAKKVQENTDVNDYVANKDFYQNYNDVADYNIGDNVPFLLEATLPSASNGVDEFAKYSAYYLKFNDTLPAGFVAPKVADIEIYVVNASGDATKVKANPYNIHKDITSSSDTKNPTTIAVTIEDVNALKKEDGNDIEVKAGDKIVVKYVAKLDSDAVVGQNGNINEVYLEYSNNPNYEYNPKTDGKGTNDQEVSDDDDDETKEEKTTPESPDVPNDAPGDTTPKEDNTGMTKEDKVIVFTYELDVTKYKDSVSDGNKVKENEVAFKLYRKVTENSEEVEQVALLDANNKITGWISATPTADNENPGTPVASEDGGIIKFIGLDDGTYTLKETKAPAGYNSVEIQVVITAETENGQTWNDFTPSGALKNLSVTADGEVGIGNVSDGKASIEVINQKGSSLPSTGGIGTTIFYLGGGTMAAVAGVYLITKKRMKNEEDDEI